jgi:23S rRNA (guanosine2251-2'-O)-methyltransferase
MKTQLSAPAEIAEALARDAPVRLLLVRAGVCEAGVDALVKQAREAGIPVRGASERALRRLSAQPERSDVLALVGPAPDGGMADVFAAGGAAWLIVKARYAQNIGAAIRTAEVSGASGVIIDASLDHHARRQALRASMRADHFMPVCWEGAGSALDGAARVGSRVVAIEDVGERAPWEVDLRGDVLFAVGGEAAGIPREVLERCDAVARLPVRGFIPSYNLQAAVAAVALERLRQLGAGEESGGSRS